MNFYDCHCTCSAASVGVPVVSSWDADVLDHEEFLE
jgi:hypothetical protein